MSKELIEQLAKDSPILSQYLNGDTAYEEMYLNSLEAFAKAYQAAAYTKVRESHEPISAAVLPNGQTCTNVYEAYEIGLNQAAAPIDNVADTIKKINRVIQLTEEKGGMVEGVTATERFLQAKINEIKRITQALLPDTQANRTEG
jgi:hypothetical protein